MATELRFGGATIRAVSPPPVYDPGGPMWMAQGRGTAGDFAAAEAAGRDAGIVQIVVPKGDPDVLVPLGFAPMSDFWVGAFSGDGDAVVATEDDLEFMLDLAEDRRNEYAKVQPVFWRASAEARPRQGLWFRHLLTLQPDGRARILISRSEAGERAGFLIASPGLVDAHDRNWNVDDFMVLRPELWATAGRRLLTSLACEVTVTCACHDEPKRALMRAAGLRPAFTWFQKTLRAARAPGPPDPASEV